MKIKPCWWCGIQRSQFFNGCRSCWATWLWGVVAGAGLLIAILWVVSS